MLTVNNNSKPVAQCQENKKTLNMYKIHFQITADIPYPSFFSDTGLSCRYFPGVNPVLVIGTQRGERHGPCPSGTHSE